MIYLIGGPPKCGKTTLAKTLSKSFGIPWVSTDTLENVIKPYLNDKDLAAKFPADRQRSRDNDEKYSKFSTSEIMAAYKRQATIVHPAIDMFAICEIADGNDFIIEGYHIEPELAAKLNAKHRNKIRSIFLVKANQAKFISAIRKSATPNDWIIARTNKEETRRKIADMIREYGIFFEKEAKKFNLKVLNMDDDFDERIGEAADYLKN